MKLWLKWTTGSAVALVAAACAFVNFWAAVELGYDAYPGGNSVIASWTYGMLGCVLVAILCGFMAVRARRASA